MNIDVLNKKRKSICRLSLTFTVITVVIGVLMLFIGTVNTYFFIGAPVFVIIFLYILSKFLIIPKYEDLRIDILNGILANKNKEYKISKSKEKFDELSNYYDIKFVKFSSKQQILLNKTSYDFVDFDLMQKKGLKNYYSDLSGKIFKFKNTLNNKEPFAFISLNNQETNKYVNFLKDNFKNINENITSLKRYKPYVALYNDYLPLEVLNAFEEINGFNCIIANKDEIIVIDLEKSIKLEFRLQDELTSNNLIDYKNAVSALLKILEKLTQFMEENSNV